MSDDNLRRQRDTGLADETLPLTAEADRNQLSAALAEMKDKLARCRVQIYGLQEDYSDRERTWNARVHEIARLRAALLGLSKQRQFGPCWCSTLGTLYCVGQEQCKKARQALGVGTSASS